METESILVCLYRALYQHSFSSLNSCFLTFLIAEESVAVQGKSSSPLPAIPTSKPAPEKITLPDIPIVFVMGKSSFVQWTLKKATAFIFIGCCGLVICFFLLFFSLEHGHHETLCYKIQLAKHGCGIVLNKSFIHV